MSEIGDFNKQVIEEFRSNDGQVGGPMAGAPLLLLNTVGAKSGEPRTNPLVYLSDGNRLAIVASWAGNDRHPPWYHNLLAHPEVEVELGAERFRARATVTGEPDRSRLYEQMAARMPQFNEYQSSTSRVIPVVTLERIE